MCKEAAEALSEFGELGCRVCSVVLAMRRACAIGGRTMMLGVAYAGELGL